MKFVNKIIIMIIKMIDNMCRDMVSSICRNTEREGLMNRSLEQMMEMTAFLAGILPSAYEIRLFDCTEKGMPIVRQRNAKRGCDDTLRKYIRRIVKHPQILENGMLLNRADVEIKGKLYKTSFYLIKDADEQVSGVLTVSILLNDFLPMYSFFNSILQCSTEDFSDIQPTPKADDEKPTLDTIDAFVTANADAPERLTPEEKTTLFIELYDMGVFELKGAVAKPAEALHMSEPSVYRYLAQIRRMRGE